MVWADFPDCLQKDYMHIWYELVWHVSITTFSIKIITIWQKIIIFWFIVTITVHCLLSENNLLHLLSLSRRFSPKIHPITHNVAHIKRQYCWKGSHTVNLVLCINSGLGFRSEYHYSENTRKLALTAAHLFRVNLEFIWNELKDQAKTAVSMKTILRTISFHLTHWSELLVSIPWLKPWGLPNAGWEASMFNCFPPHLYTLSYTQLRCYLPVRQLHSDFGDFSDGVCHITKITIAESNPDVGHNKRFASAPLFWLEPISSQSWECQ